MRVPVFFYFVWAGGFLDFGWFFLIFGGRAEGEVARGVYLPVARVIGFVGYFGDFGPFYFPGNVVLFFGAGLL